MASPPFLSRLLSFVNSSKCAVNANLSPALSLGVTRRECRYALRFAHAVADAHDCEGFKEYPGRRSATFIQNMLRNLMGSSIDETEKALDQCGFTLTDDLVTAVVSRHASDWRPAYTFFNWVSKKSGYLPGSGVYNEILDVLGKMNRFGEVTQVLEEMSKRKGLFDERTYGVLLNRYAAAHKVDEAINIFHGRRDFGLETDLMAFQALLLWLCRYKHVESAETLFYSMKSEFGTDIRTMNIILNGWCVLGDVREAKRFWKHIIASKCAPDRFTYGTFIKALTKKGKLGSAMRLFRGMSEKGLGPDVVICNCVIEALCFKKRIPQALEVFHEMKERGCLPNAATYNSLVKHMCKIERMEKVKELVTEMGSIGGDCLPNAITFSYLLKSLEKPEEVPKLLEQMEKNECKMTSDLYNLVLRLYLGWDCQERVKHIWNDMERSGMGPDERSYTIMIHDLYERGRLKEALHYFEEMVSKGMRPEPRTEILVNDMNSNIKEGEADHRRQRTLTTDESTQQRPWRRKEKVTQGLP
ncbi:putative pentatricopeptide repeat-containing protein At3g15200 [Rhodamnia argentea]|uniref:Pentatricopeptide repeat-containing protein At3g15200 n=1 Tax=Rhodamnia argentea TaxID=178133 RepID=A0A8B8MQB1_9MYRT|nr:putative pentatricopeptide repeat-containing protein At3g15200 [Rhodamnia argentea]